METTKQKFTIEFEYPIMDAKVTAEELREIIGIGLKCFGWDIKVMEEQYEDVDMEVLKIIWIDSCASNMNWTLMDELDGDIEPIKITSYGVLIQETEECVTIAQNYGENPNQCCSLMTIPKGCIKEKKVIDEL